VLSNCVLQTDYWRPDIDGEMTQLLIGIDWLNPDWAIIIVVVLLNPDWPLKASIERWPSWAQLWTQLWTSRTDGPSPASWWTAQWPSWPAQAQWRWPSWRTVASQWPSIVVAQLLAQTQFNYWTGLTGPDWPIDQTDGQPGRTQWPIESRRQWRRKLTMTHYWPSPDSPDPIDPVANGQTMTQPRPSGRTDPDPVDHWPSGNCWRWWRWLWPGPGRMTRTLTDQTRPRRTDRQTMTEGQATQWQWNGPSPARLKDDPVMSQPIVWMTRTDSYWWQLKGPAQWQLDIDDPMTNWRDDRPTPVIIEPLNDDPDHWRTHWPVKASEPVKPIEGPEAQTGPSEMTQLASDPVLTQTVVEPNVTQLTDRPIDPIIVDPVVLWRPNYYCDPDSIEPGQLTKTEGQPNEKYWTKVEQWRKLKAEANDRRSQTDGQTDGQAMTNDRRADSQWRPNYCEPVTVTDEWQTIIIIDDNGRMTDEPRPLLKTKDPDQTQAVKDYWCIEGQLTDGQNDQWPAQLLTQPGPDGRANDETKKLMKKLNSSDRRTDIDGQLTDGQWPSEGQLKGPSDDNDPVTVASDEWLTRPMTNEDRPLDQWRDPMKDNWQWQLMTIGQPRRNDRQWP